MGLCMVFRLHAETYDSKGFNFWSIMECIKYWIYVFLMWNYADLQSIMLFQFWIKDNWNSQGSMEYYWSAKVLLSRAFNRWEWDASKFGHIKICFNDNPWARPWHYKKCLWFPCSLFRISHGSLWHRNFGISKYNFILLDEFHYCRKKI